MNRLRIFLNGICMGIADIVPGISGSTLLMAFGIYEKFITSISNLTTKEWRDSLRFLIPLGIGVTIALLSFSNLITWLLAHHQPVTYYMFLGLIVGIIPLLVNETMTKNEISPKHIIIMIISFTLIALMSLVENETDPMLSLTLSDYLFLFLSGWLASSALILPGISGALIFILLGVYETVLYAVSNFNFFIIFVTGVGIAIGILTTGKLVRHLLQKYQAGTHSVMVGMVSGSTIVVYSDIESSGSLLGSTITFTIGLILAYLIGRLKPKH